MCGECVPELDDMEKTLLELALERDKLVLGICRGFQFINAALGGTLYQDLPSEHKSPIGHSQTFPGDRPAHSVRISEDSPLLELLDEERIEVNSFHHQSAKTLATGIKAMAEAPDGLVEAVYLPGKSFIWAVQWHPESSCKSDPYSMKIFNAFVKACERL
ncbi:MAG: gamma-glutamyl-gamma-aminobutyrate hydrolase family protein [Oscillospiraceae bacterium]